MNWLYKRIAGRKKIRIISFDIFDTLVERNVMDPSDVFRNVGVKVLGKTKGECFKEDRIKAEKVARSKNLSGEVTLRDIYENLPTRYNDYLQQLKEEEINEEIKICHPNDILKDLYMYCLSIHKRVVITTDMYLPKNVIRTILGNCGYNDYQRIYLSNEYNASKRSGKLFEIIIHMENVPSNTIVHFGDSLKADYISARKNGIKPVLILRKQTIRRKIPEWIYRYRGL